MNVSHTIKSAVGPLVGNRVYPNTFPQPPQQRTWPACRFTVISREADVTIDGTDTGDSDNINVQLDIVDLTYEGAKAVRDAACTALLSATCIRASESETYDTETKTHRFILGFVFTPSTPA